MAKFLITGARAPVALELARNLHRHNHKVIMVDSLRYPLARNSHAVERFYHSASPRDGIDKYKESILDVIKREQVDYLLPTCEEVFYLAYLKDEITPHCELLCEDFSLLAKLHSKYHILSLCDGMGVLLPPTRLLENNDLLDQKRLTGSVVKQEYCRFGTGVILHPTLKRVLKLSNISSGRILVQQKIQGTEYCTYAVAYNGIVYSESVYQPTYRVKVAAGIYFKPIKNATISAFIREFCKKHNYTGQIGFDVIVNNDGVYLIECNPRATSGVHLLKNMNLADALLGRKQQLDKEPQQVSMVVLAMNLVALPVALLNGNLRQWIRDYRMASDVISHNDDKDFLLFSLLSLAELIFIAIKKRINLRAASTVDIEWDGDEIK